MPSTDATSTSPTACGLNAALTGEHESVSPTMRKSWSAENLRVACMLPETSCAEWITTGNSATLKIAPALFTRKTVPGGSDARNDANGVKPCTIDCVKVGLTLRGQ